MARQTSTPVQFGKSIRQDATAIMSSGRAGVVVPVAFVPLLRGDSASGRIGIDLELAEMPRPLLNGVQVNFQAWFVPKSAHPQFAGYDEFMNSYHGTPIKALGAADRTPPLFFTQPDASTSAALMNLPVMKTLGLHLPASGRINTDLLDAYGLIWNFRAAAHSSRIARRQYTTENATIAGNLAPAFWPTGRITRIVPDYERALVVGSLELDVLAGSLPVSGIGTTVGSTNYFPGNKNTLETVGAASTKRTNDNSAGADNINIRLEAATLRPQIFAEMAGQNIGITLADIDKARTTQAFAKLRTAYAGNDHTGFDPDDVIVAELMQGFNVPMDEFNRPWLLDSKIVGVGFAERHAMDGASLDQSLTQGRVSATLSLNVPVQDVGGLIIVTCEMMPERLDERMSDEWLIAATPNDLPDALRDIQRTEPVDLVPNRRIDAKHTTPAGLYGYEPMNDKWNRQYTRLGGAFYQDTPGAPWTEQRSALWLANIVNPAFTANHWLAPQPFPHDVFADTEAPAFEFVARHNVTIVGLTQIGDILVENGDDYDAVQNS